MTMPPIDLGPTPGSTPQRPPYPDASVTTDRGWDRDDGSPWAAIELPPDGTVPAVILALGLDPHSDEDRQRFGWYDGWLYVDGIDQATLDAAATGVVPYETQPDPVARALEELWVAERVGPALAQVKAQLKSELKKELADELKPKK